MAESIARAQAAAEQAKQGPDPMAVDWTKVERQSFRRVFLDGACSQMHSSEAAARRASLGIEVEQDPNGGASTPLPLLGFSELSVLPRWVAEALAENKWEKPLPVQAQALPILLSGRNLVGIAQTGSGKTGAFLVPAIVHANDQRPLRWSDPGPIVLVLSPTRELAVQISDEAEKLLRHSSSGLSHPGGLRSCCFYGGGRKGEQLGKFTRDGSHIVVATPGRLLDFCREKKVSLHRVTYLCLDEADRMLDLGFLGDMEYIGAAIRPERQTVFFSATWPKEVQALTGLLCAETPVTIRVGRTGDGNKGVYAGASGGEAGDDDCGGLLAREGITQQVVVIDFPQEAKPWQKQDEEKRRLLDEHIKMTMAQEDCKMIIFVNQKNFATELSEKLWNDGIQADAIHGGRPQETRLWILDKFRKGETRLLIATDVIGRGLDIPKVSHVVVYAMNGVEDYIHRIGRTGRGKDGTGHALVFFEYSGTQPETAGELIAVLRKSRQPVPPELERIAQEVAAGKRWSKSLSNGGSWNVSDTNTSWNK